MNLDNIKKLADAANTARTDVKEKNDSLMASKKVYYEKEKQLQDAITKFLSDAVEGYSVRVVLYEKP